MKKSSAVILGLIIAFLVIGCGAAKEPGEMSLLNGNKIVGKDIGKDDITDFYYTEKGTNRSDEEDMTPMPSLVVNVGEKAFSIAPADNSSAEEFLERVNQGGLTIDMYDYGDFEKVGDLPWDLPVNDEKITTVPGDVILYQGDKITIYYDENTWNFTKLGHLNATTEEIQEAFGGQDDLTAEFFVEWTE